MKISRTVAILVLFHYGLLLCIKRGTAEVWSVGLQTLLWNVLNIHIAPTGRYLEWMQMDQSGLFLSTRTSHYNGGTEGLQ